jgi:hypothetical protein
VCLGCTVRDTLTHMDWLTFIDHLIGHLAWPLVVAALVLFLSLRHRVALDTLLHRVRKARAGPFEAELDEAKVEAERASLPLEPTVLPRSDDLEADLEKMRRLKVTNPEEWLGFFMELADRDPYTAVQGSLHVMSGYLYQAADLLDPKRARIMDIRSGAGRAASVGLLTPEHEKVVNRLRDAALSAKDWDEQVSRRQAREFVLLVARLVSAVQERLHMLFETRQPPE